MTPRRVRSRLRRGPTSARTVARCRRVAPSRLRVVHGFPETATKVVRRRRRRCTLELMEMSSYDVAVVGGGAAGLSAALVLGRARRRVAVIDAGSPRNAPAAHMQGFLSRDGMPPGELLALGRDGGRGLRRRRSSDGTRRRDRERRRSRFRVTLRDGRSIAARRLLVATGLRDEIPDIPGLRERWARDVLHCPYCHGFEVRDQKLGVLGRLARGSPTMPRSSASGPMTSCTSRRAGTLSAAERRASWAPEGSPSPRAPRSGSSVEDDRLRGVELDGGRTVACDALFVPPRFVPNSDLLVGSRLRSRRGRTGRSPTATA